MPVFLLDDRDGNRSFPPAHLASDIGLLAVGGDLSRERLLLAYQQGIFPWFSGNEPIMWWSPDPRLVLYPSELRVARSLAKTIKRGTFEITIDACFDEVIDACARIPRKDQGTWITPGMIGAYRDLHRAGFAHSVEAWCEGSLAGGLYGVSLGKCFFGESMFSRVSNSSKVAFTGLIRHLHALSFDIIDCQVTTEHLKRFGAREISRSEFLSQLNRSLGGSDAPDLDGSHITAQTRDHRFLTTFG